MIVYIYDCSRKLNLTIEIVKLPKELKLLENGTWTGSLGMLSRNEIDIESSGTVVKADSLVDCTIPTQSISLTLFAMLY